MCTFFVLLLQVFHFGFNRALQKILLNNSALLFVSGCTVLQCCTSFTLKIEKEKKPYLFFVRK